MLYTQDLIGKTALITGSTSGIGLSIAKKLASQGVHIAITGLGDTQQNEILTHQIAKEHNITAYFFNNDLSQPESTHTLIKNVFDKMQKIDILVNNAGMQYVSKIENFPDDKWDLILALNLSAAFHLSKAVLPSMRQNKFGRIINIASVHGLVASAEKAAYVASKHGLIGLTKVISLETAQDNITCNAICPGWVLTPLVQAQIDAIAQQNNLDNSTASQKLLHEKQPSLEFVLPEHISDYVTFLCSDSASQITGSTQIIDGGWTAR